MNTAETFQEFLASQITQSTVWGVILNLFIAALLGYWVGRVYIKYGKSLSNRRAFAHNFIMLTMTTTLIITIIQSNLALSLGMIGALSIVRFRSAIKEPEELSYLFLSIAAGLGLGANLRILTIVALAIIIGIIRLKNILGRDHSPLEQNLHFSIVTYHPEQLSLEKINEVLEKNCSTYRMKRVDRTEDVMEVNFLVEFIGKESLQSIESSLRQVDGSIKITFFDHRGGISGIT